MFGALTLGRLLEPAGGGSGGGSAVSTGSAGSMGAPSAERRLVGALPHFLSAQPARVIVSRLRGALTEMQAVLPVDDSSFKVKGTLASSRGEISLVAQVYLLSDELHLVEIRRGKGDILEYRTIFTRLREKLDDLVARPRSRPST